MAHEKLLTILNMSRLKTIKKKFKLELKKLKNEVIFKDKNVSRI